MTIKPITNNTLKSVVTEDILNPLIDQHNKTVLDVSDHELRLKNIEAGGGGVVGPSTFVGLVDTPDDYTGSADKAVVVNGTGDSLVFADRVTKFTDLTDTLPTLTSGKGMLLGINNHGTGMVFSEKIKKLSDLDDFEDLSGKEGKLLAINSKADGVEFVNREGEDPTKWYILPIAGQSNATGFGEIIPPQDPPNPRLKQLAVYDSPDEKGSYARFDYVVPAACLGPRFREFRPMEKSNLKLIPLTPNIDSSQNMLWAMTYDVGRPNHTGGTVSPGYFLAKALLPYIPKDYGIAVVQYSFGASGFDNKKHTIHGTYDEVNMRSDIKLLWPDGYKHSNNWWWQHSLAKAFYNRVKHALNMNKEHNKLLPVIWMQGENDENAIDHSKGFKDLVIKFRDQLVADGFEQCIGLGRKRDFRWICAGFASGLLLGCDKKPHEDTMNYLDNKIDFKQKSVGSYDNYSYLMEDPDLQDPFTGEPQVISLRSDIDANGNFIETTMQECKAHGLSSIMGQWSNLHWSTRALAETIAPMLLNTIGKYGKCLEGLPYHKQTRHVAGRLGTVSTDGVVFEYDNTVDVAFNTGPDNPDIIINRDFKHNKDFTNQAYFSRTSETMQTASDSNMGAVAEFKGSELIHYTKGSSEAEDWTLSFVCKLKAENRDDQNYLLAPAPSSNKAPCLLVNHGSLKFSPFWASDNEDSQKTNIILSKHMHGAWKGGYSDWQHLAFVHKKDLKTVHVYVNGCLIHSFVNIETGCLESFKLGALDNNYKFHGFLSTFRAYKSALTSGEVNALTSRLLTLRKQGVDSDTYDSKSPSKWYVLPLAGQSNAWGCAELPWTPVVHPRLMQLSCLSSNPETNDRKNVRRDCTPYGSDFRKFRPVDDTNLKMIPAVPCLDSVENGFWLGASNRSGYKYGNTGPAYFIAKALLPYIPEDYGILIVPVTRGGGGIVSGNDKGSYDTKAMTASLDSSSHGVGSPYHRMLLDRVKYALKMNPENKLLPFIWMQGESDPNAEGHMTAFKSKVADYKKMIEDNNLSNRLPYGSIDNFKIVCVGSTRFQFFQKDKPEYLDYQNYRDYKDDMRARFDNYAYLMDDPDYINRFGESCITFVRADVDEEGKWVPTMLEEHRQILGNENGVFGNFLDFHFARSSYETILPRLLVNSLAKSKMGYLINAPTHSTWTRPVPGRRGTVSTDNSRYYYPMRVDPSFDPSANLLVGRNYVSNVTNTDSKFTSVKDDVGITTVADPADRYASFDPTNTKGLSLTSSLTNGDKTMSIMFRCKASSRDTEQMIIGGTTVSDSTDGMRLWQNKGQIYVFWNHKEPGNNLCLNKSIQGAWKGGWEDWQHLTVTHSARFGLVDVYLNGCLIHTSHGSKLNFNSIYLGGRSDTEKRWLGDVRYFRLYDRYLSEGEAGSLYYIDTKNKGV